MDKERVIEARKSLKAVWPFIAGEQRPEESGPAIQELEENLALVVLASMEPVDPEQRDVIIEMRFLRSRAMEIIQVFYSVLDESNDDELARVFLRSRREMIRKIITALIAFLDWIKQSPWNDYFRLEDKAENFPKIRPY